MKEFIIFLIKKQSRTQVNIMISQTLPPFFCPEKSQLMMIPTCETSTKLRKRPSYSSISTMMEKPPLKSRPSSLLTINVNAISLNEPILVWALFGSDQWWPALLYRSLRDFEADVSPDLDPVEYRKLKLHLKAMTRFNNGTDHETIRFLGKSVHDFRVVRGDSNTVCRRFFGKSFSKMHRDVIFQPSAFAMDDKEYFDFHDGLDEAMMRANKSHATGTSYSKIASEKWDSWL